MRARVYAVREAQVRRVADAGQRERVDFAHRIFETFWQRGGGAAGTWGGITMVSLLGLQRCARWSGLLLVLLTLALAVGVSPARGATTICSGTIISPKITTNVVVPAGATCSLLPSVVVDGQVVGDGTAYVKGNIRVGEGATLNLGCFRFAIGLMCGGVVTVSGNVIAHRAAGVSVQSDILEGNLIVTETASVSTFRSTVHGNAVFAGNEDVALIETLFHGNLVCSNNERLANFISGAEHAVGQCAV